MAWKGVTEVNFALEDCFRQIQQQRMVDVPILNPRLQVQAVDFQLFQQTWLGILITPWFMNLLYLWDDPLTVGTKISHQFPAGQFEFTVAYEKSLGFYQSCSLYSPMFEFEEQQMAVLTAQEILKTLLKEVERPAISRRDLLRGRFRS